MTTKIRDKAKDILKYYGTAPNVKWLCTTIEKLCNAVDRYKKEEQDSIREFVIYKEEQALKEGEDEI